MADIEQIITRIKTPDEYALTRTVRGYSAGTRVDLMNYTKAHTAFVSVLSTKEVLEISQDDIVRLRPRKRAYAT
jgi:hypothetical protein